MRLLLTYILALAIGFSAMAQTTDTVSLGANYAFQVYYELESGNKTSGLKNDWDIAFETTTAGYSILVNAAIGTELYLYPGDTSNWATVDTTGMSNWTRRLNSDTSWQYGAFARDQNSFDVGWGTYNIITHQVEGDKLFVIKLGNGQYQKVWIKSLANGVYTFRHGNLSGSMDMTHSLKKSDYAGKDFVHYSLQNHSVRNKEPLADNWDLFFGQFEAFVPTPYLVAGVLHKTGCKSAMAYPVADPSTFNDFGIQQFSNEINVLGYDWKSYNMAIMDYELADSTVYFVRTAKGAIWKIIFLDFEGGSTGNVVFSKEKLIAAGLTSENGAGTFNVFPNPVDKVLNIVFTSQVDLAYTMVDLSGRVHLSGRLAGNSTAQSINVQDLTPGVYFLTLTNGQQSNSQRVLVK
ncbi:MAG: T9SS type A sorting domain-containing protein [Vicingaceae bacterium]